MPINRPKKQSENDKRICNLVQRLETGHPTPITALEFTKALAHLQTSKFRYNDDVDSDSDSDEEPEEVFLVDHIQSY